MARRCEAAITRVRGGTAVQPSASDNLSEPCGAEAEFYSTPREAGWVGGWFCEECARELIDAGYLQPMRRNR